MATDRDLACARLLEALADPVWSTTLLAIDAATTFLRADVPGDTPGELVRDAVAALGDHSKWEVRRAVCETAGTVPGAAFEAVLIRLAADDNSQVRQSAVRAMARRRDWRATRTLGAAHADRINASLIDIESRFGVPGREAVKRVAEQLTDDFAREVYHELARLLSPLGVAADRLTATGERADQGQATVEKEVRRIQQQVKHMKAILDGMRLYSAVPELRFTEEAMMPLVEDAVRSVRDAKIGAAGMSIEVEAQECHAEVARSRILQALTNLLTNAVEAYDGMNGVRKPIRLRLSSADGILAIRIHDSGCGMSDEDRADAAKLFATRKVGGSGVGVPLALKIIQSEHFGTLEITSTAGVGTEVRVHIPVRRLSAR